MALGVRQLVSAASLARMRGEMAWIVLGQTAATVGGLVGVRVLTEVLSPDRYGELALGITLGTLGQLVAWSPISGAVLRYFASAQESSQLNAYLQAVRRLLVQATAALVGLGLIVVLALAQLGAARWIGLSVAALVFTLLSGYEAALDNMQLAGRQRGVVAWHQGISAWLRFLVAVALVSVFGPSSAVAMLGFALGVLFVLASQAFFFFRRVLPLRERNAPSSEADAAATARRMTHYAWPIAAWGVFTWVQMVSDRWVLQGFTTTSTVGMYMVLYQLGFYPMTVLSAATLQFISPVLFERAGDGSDPSRLEDAWRLVVTIVAVTLAATAVATLAAWLLHRSIFGLLAGVHYRQASHLLPWMLCAGGLIATGQAASQAVLVSGVTKRLIVPKGIIAMVTLGLYVLGAHLRGLEGIVYANLAFGVLYVGWMLRLAREWRTGALGRPRAASAEASLT